MQICAPGVSALCASSMVRGSPLAAGGIWHCRQQLADKMSAQLLCCCSNLAVQAALLSQVLTTPIVLMLQTAEADPFMNSWAPPLDALFFAEAPGAPTPSLSSSVGSSWARPQTGQSSQAGLDATNVGLMPGLHFMGQPNAVPPYPSSMAQGHLGQGTYGQQPQLQAGQHQAQPMESRAPSGFSTSYPAGGRWLPMESRGPSGFSNVYPRASQGLPPTSQPLSVLDEARALLEFGTAQPTYVPEQQFTRMSAKLFNCTPSHLPPDLKQDLVDLLSCGINSVEGYIRPGCVHLVLGAIMSRAQYKQLAALDIRQAVEQLVTSSNKDFWSADTVLVRGVDRLHLVVVSCVNLRSSWSPAGLFEHGHAGEPSGRAACHLLAART